MLPDRIRQSLNPIHDAIERTPLATAMISGTVTRDDYLFALVQLRYLHQELEDALASASHPLYHADQMARSAILQSDLNCLGYSGDGEPCDAARELGQQFHAWSLESPHRLIGALYVFEGSRMGSMALVRPVARALGLEVRPGHGVDYHIDGMATRPQAWGRFKAEIASFAFDSREQNEICESAVQTMQTLHTLYAGAAQPELATAR
ncbi:MAG: biliverdin-producing heme oxygenase [Gemmataceae bacterium]